MIPVTRPLARFIVNSRLDDMPEQVRHEGVRAFVNWLGCVLGGSQEDVLDRAMATYGKFSGPAQSIVIGRGRRLDAPTAALLNTMSNFAHGYNDTHLATVAHPMGAPASAVFAQAECQVISGNEFVHAFVLGVETACRIANMLAAPPAHAHVGLSIHGISNVFGAAAALGKVLRLNEDQMVWALGLAAMQASGLRSAYGTMGTKLIAGHAARCGMMAAYLAENGFNCSDTPIEDEKGLAAVFSSTANLQAATDRLGLEYEMMRVAYKPYPCGIVIHPAIDACLKIAADPAFDSQIIDRVELRVHPMTLSLCNRPRPSDRIQALTSAHHWIATSLLYQAAGLKQGANECVRDPQVTALRERITLNSDPGMADMTAAATVFLGNGKQLSAVVTECYGSLEHPMTDRGLDDKFLNQAALVMTQGKAQALLAEAWKLPSYDNVGSMAKGFLE